MLIIENLTIYSNKLYHCDAILNEIFIDLNNWYMNVDFLKMCVTMQEKC